MNSKEKGNREERKQAKQLSTWIFDDPDVLKRHHNSGADKTVYSGDIVPMKQLEQFGWKKFGLIIEVKSGYPKDKPTFWNYERVADWYRKAKIEGFQANQNIILLICQFKNMQALLITDQYFDNKIHCNVCVPINMYNGKIEFVYVYLLKDVLKYDFYQLFEGLDYK